MKVLSLTAFAALFASLSLTSQAGERAFALGLNAGTLGVGAAATVNLSQRFNARAFIAGLSVDPGIEAEADDEDGVSGNELEYDGDFELLNFGAMLDFHPFAGGFRMSAGLVNADIKLDGEATCNRSGGCELGDNPGVVLNGDRVDAEVEFEGVAPYLGIGWGNAVSTEGRWSFSFDVGVLFTGDADASVSCRSVSPVNQAACQASANEEERELEDDLDDYELYPVLMLGAAYRF